jgi:carbonic anhydrase/acetyltransferase-like protein (isoleucine patch superfamily)
MTVVKRVKSTPYHNLHTLCFLISYVIMHMDVQLSAKPLFVAGNATIIGDITFGNQVGIWFGAVIRGDKDRIIIGDRSNIQDNCVVHTSKGFPVTIGNDVSVGHGAILHGCTIHNQVLIGMGAIVLNGAKIGEGSIIGAGAVITEGKEIPRNSVVIGVPGKIVKQTDAAQQQHILNNAIAYMELAREYLHHG